MRTKILTAVLVVLTLLAFFARKELTYSNK
jgi:hypothetical protein